MLAAISYPTVVKVHIGPLAISPHGVGIAVGFLLGARLLLPEAERKGIPEDNVYPLLIRAFIGALIGARLAYVINHLSDYSSPLDVLKVWQGGISLLGGFIGAIVVSIPAIRSRRISFWRIMDAAAPGMALGVIVGRVGDLIVGDHLGKTTSLPFGFKCPTDVSSTASPCLPGPGAVVHQTALYDLVLTCLLIGVLLWLRRHRPRYDGFLISLFGVWYGCQRILEDFLREDKHIVGSAARGLTGSQVTSIIVVLVCLWHLIFVRKTPRWGRWGEPLPEGESAEAAAGDETEAAETAEPEFEAVDAVATESESESAAVASASSGAGAEENGPEENGPEENGAQGGDEVREPAPVPAAPTAEAEAAADPVPAEALVVDAAELDTTEPDTAAGLTDKPEPATSMPPSAGEPAPVDEE